MKYWLFEQIPRVWVTVVLIAVWSVLVTATLAAWPLPISYDVWVGRGLGCILLTSIPALLTEPIVFKLWWPGKP